MTPSRGILARAIRGLRRAHEDDDREGGAALVEFAVVFPAQLFVTLALMQFSLMCVGHILVGHAAWAAARAALVSDIATTAGGNADPQTAANDAAALILAPICPSDLELENASGVTPSNGATRPMNMPPGGDQKLKFPTQGGGFDIARKKGAYCLAQVTIDPGDVASAQGDRNQYCCARVQFEFPLIIPVVNRWFAKAGEYLLYGIPSDSNVPGIGNTDYPTVTITKTGFVPRPWSKQ